MIDVNGEIHRFNKSPEQLCKSPETVIYDRGGLNLRIRIGLKTKIEGKEYVEKYSLWVNGTHFDKLPVLPSTTEENPSFLDAVVEANGVKILDGQRMMWAHEAL